MPSVHKDITDFYARHDIGQVNPDTNMLNLTIATDGVYSHTKEARQCNNYAICPYTGLIPDYSLSEKCFVCPDHRKFGTRCERDLWHGASAEMERQNVLNLFRSSEEIGFRYVEYICDGDAKVVAAVRDLQPYGEGVMIEKTECANHLINRAKKKLHVWGRDWNLEGFEERNKKGKKG